MDSARLFATPFSAADPIGTPRALAAPEAATDPEWRPA